MTTHTMPTLYDILGVPRDASPEEIRAAWRDAADRFAPGEGGSTRQFRLFNEAAEVLLDPERRREYDASLEPTRATDEPVEAGEAGEPDESGEPAQARTVPDAPVPGASSAGAGAAGFAAEGAATDDAADQDTADQNTASGQPETEETARSGRGRSLAHAAGAPVRALVAVLGVWTTIAVAVLAALAIGVAAYFVTEAQQAEGHLEALDRAPAAAENAALAVLSYDYKSLEADRDAAAKFLTPEYRKQYVDTFDKLVSKSASESKATVKAKVLASSAMTVGSDESADRVPVLLFVNQTTTSATTEEPSVALNRVRFDMVRRDGTWLIDGITSY